MNAGFLLLPNEGEDGPLRDARSAPRLGAPVSNRTGWGSGGVGGGRTSWGESAGGGRGRSSASGTDDNIIDWGPSVAKSACGGGWERPNADDDDAMDVNGSASAATSGQGPPPPNPMRGMPFIPKDAIGAPRRTLVGRYVKKYSAEYPSEDHFPPLDTCFVTWDDGNPRTDLKMYTSVFICPQTGERFAAGLCAQWDSKIKNEVRTEALDASEVGGTVVQVVWYAKKKKAMDAAAARALDCLSLREEAGSYGICLEEPYRNAEEAPPLPPSMPDAMDTDGGDQAPAVPAAIHAPKIQLLQRYVGQWSPREYFAHDELRNLDTKNMMYTSIFTCPVTGERWASGQYGEPDLRDVRMDDDGGVLSVWYPNKKAAEIAAAARALDCLQARDRGNAAGGERLCVESPYLVRADAPPLPLSLQDEAPGKTVGVQLRRDVPPDTQEQVDDRSEYRAMRAP